MSVLILNPKNLYKNECKADQHYDLQSWFTCNEDLAWEKVNTFFVKDWPENIFLIISQMLSPSYAITYMESTSQKIEIIVEASATISELVENSMQFLK